MTATGPQEKALAQVAEGMAVVDSEGHQIGTVAAVVAGDPDSYAHVGEPGADRAPLTEQLAALFTPDSSLTEQARARLAREGYVRVDLAGVFSGTAYAEPGQVERVDDGTVRLSVPESYLLR